MQPKPSAAVAGPAAGSSGRAIGALRRTYLEAHAAAAALAVCLLYHLLADAAELVRLQIEIDSREKRVVAACSVSAAAAAAAAAAWTASLQSAWPRVPPRQQQQ